MDKHYILYCYKS